MSIKPLKCVVLLVALLWSSGRAAVIQVDITGTVDLVNDVDHVLAGIVQVGQPYTATYAFDTTAPDTMPSNHHEGEYVGGNASFQLPTVNGAGTTLLDVSTDLDNLYFSAFAPSWYFTATVNPIMSLTSDHTPWPFPQVANARFFVSKGKSSFEGSIGSVIATEVPEPCLGGLLCISTCLLRRR